MAGEVLIADAAVRFGARRAVHHRTPEWFFEIQIQECGTLTIDGIGGLDWLQAASQGMQKRNAGKTASGFAIDDFGADTANISSDAKNLTPQSDATGDDVDSITREPSGIVGLTDPRILAYQKRMWNDRSIILFDRDLTDDDKQMLASLNGGNWQQNGSANHLVDQIATARHDGTITGPISNSFIQNIIDKQRLNTPFDPEHKLDPIPQSVLDRALDWIKTRSEQAATAGE